MSSEAQATAAVAEATDSPAKKSNKKLCIWLGILVFIVFEVWAYRYVHPSMERVTNHPHNLEEIFGWKIPLGGVNAGIIINTWLVMGVLILLGIIGRLHLKT